MIEAVFPSSLARCSRRIGLVLILLAVLTAVLFPASAVAGTETSAARWVTTAVLALVGLTMRVVGGRPIVAVGALAALCLAGWILSANWLLVFGGGALAYLALTLFPRTGGAAADVVAESPELPTAEIVRENIEAVAMALILALTVRQFAVEAFVIPTGSMQPTILGQLTFPADAKRPGDRLVASKIPVLMNDLPRFSIVVFHFPLFRPTNYIKRLIGLPGEKLEIRNGDVWVNDERIVKPDAVQESLWFRDFPDPASSAAPDYEGTFNGTDETAVTFGDASIDLTSSSDVWTWLNYDGYLEQSNDVRLGLAMEADASAVPTAVLLRLDSPGRRVELEFTADGAFLTAPGVGRQAVVELAGLRPAEASRVALGVADGVARVYVDGRLAVKHVLTDERDARITRRAVRVGVKNGAVSLSEITFDRDIHYQGRHTWQIPKDRYIMLGDNTSSSQDSRKWNANVVTMRDGTKFVADKDVRLNDGPPQVNYRIEDGHYLFLDSNGVARKIAVEDATVERMDLPFVHRSDLIGRAFFIFYPFPPFGDFRPRFLP